MLFSLLVRRFNERRFVVVGVSVVVWRRPQVVAAVSDAELVAVDAENN